MSFRLKLTVTISLLIAIAFSIGGTVLISSSFNASLAKETNTALTSFETIQNTLYLINSLGEKTDSATLSETLAQMEQQDTVRWQALRLHLDGKVIYENGSVQMLTVTMPTPDIDQCVYAHLNDDYGHGLQIYSVIPTDEEDLLLEARFDLSSVYETRGTQLQLYYIIYGSVVSLGLLASIALSFALTRRLKRLTGAMRQIAGGDLTTRSRIQSRDEFGQLSSDLDAMADTLEANIHHLEEDMQRQEKFMGNFAHELKTPMTSIIGYADLLRQGDLDEDTRIMAAGYIFSEGKRLEKLSFKLLELLLLKKEDPVMQPVSLPAFVHDVNVVLRPMLQTKNIQFSCKYQRGTAYLEPDLVKSLLYNLMDNAVKATDENGIITLKAGLIPGGCRFQITDNGRGMEQVELAKITDAFYRIDKSRARSLGGAGLGLSLCKEIAALHNGHLQFASKPGKGTQVTVTLYGKEGLTHE